MDGENDTQQNVINVTNTVVQEDSKKNRKSKKKKNTDELTKNLLLSFIIVTSLAIITMIIVLVNSNMTIQEMHRTYINNTDNIIKIKEDQKMADDWTRLPDNEKRERLRSQYTEIITYYTTNVDSKYKMSAEQIGQTFEQLYSCLKSVPRINFFIPLAYMKVASNFNPVYNRNWRYGIATFFQKAGEEASNLPIVRTDKAFFTVWKGLQTLNRPDESIKLLIAKIDDLMITFNNREDWVFLALFTNEYEVISKYWNDGQGAIPEEKYRTGQLSEVLKYYYAFKNWEIPSRDAK